MEPDTSHEEKAKVSDSITDRPDGWLLREWKSGNERAAEVLLDRYAIRLVALVASRLNRRYQASIDPSEVVQSAMGSFFDAARHSRIQVSGSVSLWRLLATFARRKMARSIERQSAIKRGGDQIQHSLSVVDEATSPYSLSVLDEATSPHSLDTQGLVASSTTTQDEADAFLTTLRTELTDDLFAIVEGLLLGQTQRELAESLGIAERTVRRRLSRIRRLLAPKSAIAEVTALAAESLPALPRVNYNEFVLGKLIGSGGFGKVYLARMQSDGRTVAVKFLRKAFWQIEEARQSFLREINIASQISHPGIIRYLGYGESPHGGPYVISKWIDGQSLQNASDAEEQQWISWLVQICEAIQAVHQVGLIHGDLTPNNILVDAQDRITITDFGFSQASAKSALPVLGGTLGFAAPEQITPAFGSISFKTDIYAIGGLLHWVLFRQPPNAGQSFEDTLTQTLSPQHPRVSTFDAILPAFRKILIATLRKPPADRSMGLTDIIQALLETTRKAR
ncbi:protein kinase domain-containing protein [Allorhodopirellula solitaria]|uniref:Serine/threonine-protein kinase PknB n=1 Tax=Allorhodopirellula solitaria TaxID=2527987 RepID=A0A5C5YJ36_9BACT|nr:protein kinase [Allorhodopirellula solitaria]TWT74877.1 Serine/threonine-protein kinase PknB [Allorhodopirellula solitaria]